MEAFLSAIAATIQQTTPYSLARLPRTRMRLPALKKAEIEAEPAMVERTCKL